MHSFRRPTRSESTANHRVATPITAAAMIASTSMVVRDSFSAVVP
jgi:hypothetical protein